MKIPTLRCKGTALILLMLNFPLFGGVERRENSISLNGIWEYSVVYEENTAESIDEVMHRSDWKTIALPNSFERQLGANSKAVKGIRHVWARRKFKVTSKQATALGVLRWQHITFGATAYLNGKKVGQNIPIGPYQTLLPMGSLKGDENTILLKIPGWAGIIKGEKNYPLFPVGSGTQNWGLKHPGIWEDIWIDFADRAYMKWILAIPDLKRGLVRFRTTLSAHEPLDQLQISATVKSASGEIFQAKIDSEGSYTPEEVLIPENHFFLEVPLPEFTPWTFDNPHLYTANLQLSRSGETLDTCELRFGMREIEYFHGNLRMNGKGLWLRGSNLVGEWLSEKRKQDSNSGFLIEGNEKEFLIDEAREMNINAFRTHSLPLNTDWANIADENGMMILAEFPILYNYSNFGFSKEEYEVFHGHCLSDTAAWMASLWNHPAIIFWVLSNESKKDENWENNEFQNFVLTLDPTRLTMRSGNATAQLIDFHGLSQWRNGQEGHFQLNLNERLKKTNRRAISDTEYMNNGPNIHDNLSVVLDYAQRGMEDTEAMRRLRFDIILPYMYRGWTRIRNNGKVWKDGFAHPAAACWHSALSPVLASLDLFDPSYTTSQEISTQLFLINESWHDVNINVELIITKECPEFIPESKIFENPENKWSMDYELKANRVTQEEIHWQLPNKEGSYWLTARTTGTKGRPVLSQRFIRAIRPPTVSEKLKGRTFLVLGADSKANSYFNSNGLQMLIPTDPLDPQSSMVVIWNAARLTENEKTLHQKLTDFAELGGTIAILSTPVWDWNELCQVSIKNAPRSRVYFATDKKKSLLKRILPQYLKRWNGLPGIVAIGTISGEAVEQGEKILMGKSPLATVAARIPMATGSGTVLFSQLDIQSHVDRKVPNYDPVSERILLNLLGI